MNNFFTTSLQQSDSAVFNCINDELMRQSNHIELIASENIVSRAVLQAVGSVLTNKYAEGYANARYYHGCECVDNVEILAIERAKQLFNAQFVNVQPHSGSSANAAVFLALLKPNDTILGMSLDAGGHLTHGSKVSSSGKYYQSIAYDVDDNGLIDYDAVLQLAKLHRPQLIIAGGSAYSRFIDFKKFREIADAIGAYLFVDMAHFAGLVAAKLYPNPLEYADIVTSTTHKTLRGPRGGIILTNNESIAKKINSAVFPGLQGGPLMHVIAGKAVAFQEALSPTFTTYMQQVIDNAKTMEQTLKNNGYNIVSDGTDSHLLLLDLQKQRLKGNIACDALAKAGLICNKNTVPNDPEGPRITSGLRIGSPAGTTRGFGVAEFKEITLMMIEILNALQKSESDTNTAINHVKERVNALCTRFPIYNTNIKG